MIPTRYINAGPMPAQANAQPAMAAGRALESVGTAIAQTGAAGLEILGKVRRASEAGAISAFMAQADEKAGSFSIELARRSDTDAWPLDWKNRVASLKEDGKALGLSPEAAAQLDGEFSRWASTRSIHFETQAATKGLGIARAQTTQALDYYANRNDKEGFERTSRTAAAGGILNPAEVEQAQTHFREQEASIDLERMIDGNPQSLIDQPDETILAALPGATLDMVARGRNAAEAKVQQYRSDEMDTLEGALGTEKLSPKDIEAAAYLTPRDREALVDALGQKDPPSNENHGAAWGLLGTLRDARSDPSVTPENYRVLWNETRGSVLRRIAPKWQGDIRQELSNLSPAGRHTDPARIVTAYEKGDLEAQGRDVAFRARDAGFFGSVGDDAPPAEREKAFRKAEDIRLAVKRFVAGKPEAAPEEIRDFTDGLISGDRVKSNALQFQNFVPGAAQRLRPAPAMPPLPAKSARKDQSAGDPMELPPGAGTASDALLPPLQQLENFLK